MNNKKFLVNLMKQILKLIFQHGILFTDSDLIRNYITKPFGIFPPIQTGPMLDSKTVIRIIHILKTALVLSVFSSPACPTARPLQNYDDEH